MDPLGADDPQVIGAYRLLGRLGSGGMGRVFVGRSAGGRTVAVKVVHAHFALDEEFRARFRREVDAARRVGGAFTAPVLDADPEARIPWVATGYVAGPPLNQAVTDEGPLPESSVRALGAGLAEALAAVHALGLVHRDVKPSNVLLALDGPRLIDFGIARATEGTVSLTSTGASIGSPGYMAPEQILGENVEGAADVFSLGAVLAYAATGEPPFPGDTSAALLYKVVHDEPRFGRELTGELRDLVAACLAKNPADRPTPEQIVRRLAPEDGASGLARPGWLPGALVERVSRRVVELLDLEAEAVAPPSAPESADARPADARPSGAGWPVTEPPAEPSDAAPPAEDRPTPPPTPAPGPAAPVLGAFGPPDPSYADRPQSYADRPRGEDRSAAHPLPAPPPSKPGGGRSVSLSAAVGGKKRPKALSCTLVLSVAGALAAATTAAVLFQVLPGGSDDSSDQNAGAKPRPSATERQPGAGDTGSEKGDVSKAFIGTWQGDLTSDSGIPVGALTITFRQGPTGREVASGRVKLSVLRCDFTWKLVSAAPKQLHLDARLKGSEPQQGCSDASTDEQFTLTSDGTISYQAKDEQAGDPTGTLRKLK
ncbi:serine/threonine-protein kinase [Streptomyces rapamycinicus]|uniref:Serine/threonine protein kinase n=3 Tax=Streptomyces rapamycinicus TaxID=1226757 RepID=A0A3L8RMY1_STRRN|nr:serine/threonine-protein kinase [Streptomyces rapamycinicus]MBB4783539.1 serine/threonine protein kinase [Streptomyces rapamycinicus]RLV80987.1 serine/threonine protein kinase [Streptomyces rapamycinicus NRRL 5491]UTO63924.1 serine/threonine protein kinase [Streptomyces rapamycinicus]UTP31879.1 serine/threonine protein kinase [Streptomyces rapamycinicus NRRL 5491]